MARKMKNLYIFRFVRDSWLQDHVSLNTFSQSADGSLRIHPRRKPDLTIDLQSLAGPRVRCGKGED